MKRRTVFLAALPAAFALIAGCAGIDTVQVEVSSQSEWPAGREPGTYAIERLPSQQANAAEQDRIEAAAIPAIEAAGFTRAPREEADVLIQVGARAFQVASRYSPYAHPFYWRHDWWFYRGYRPFFYGPGWGYGYYNDFPEIQRETAILIRDRSSEKIVYETRAALTTRWSSDALLPLMFQASMQDFPTPALSPRTVTMTLPKG